METDTSTEITTTQNSTELAAVVAHINELHAQAEELAKQAKSIAAKTIEAALECGKLLIERKAELGHGNWENWCKTNLKFSIETAKRYMRLYRKSCDEIDGTSNRSQNESVTVLENTNPSQSESVSFVENAKPKTLRQAYIATGILAESPKAVQPTEDKITPLVVHVKHIDTVVLWYRKTVEQNPAKNWKWIEREALINDLTPLMEIYNELIELQEKSQKERTASTQN